MSGLPVQVNNHFKFVCLFQETENKEELKTKLKELIREKSDAFNSDTYEEDKVLSTELRIDLHCLLEFPLFLYNRLIVNLWVSLRF